MLKKVVFTIGISLWWVVSLYADTVYLKNGNKVSGIITKEDENSVEIKINIGAVVVFSRQDIERVEKDSDEARAKIESLWESERKKKELAEMEEALSIEAADRSGLVEYDGKWVTPQEKERLEAASIAGELLSGQKDKRFSSRLDKLTRSNFARRLLEKGNWFIKETENFSVFYREPSQAKIITDKAEYYFEKILYDLGYEKEIKWKERCQVYIVENQERWQVFLKEIGFNPELVGGFVPNYEKKEMFICALSDGYLAITFPHELTHLLFRDIAKNRPIPLWLNEGLANYEASVTNISNELLIRHIKNGSHILLGDLLRMGVYPEGKVMRELFYAQSEKMVEFLITQYGRKKFRNFCDLLLKDRSFNDALAEVYKGDFKDISDFNIKLVEYIIK